MTTSARSRLLFALAPALVTLAVVGLAIGAAVTLRTANSWVDHTRLVLSTSDAVMVSTLDAETAVRGFAVTGDSVYLAPGIGARERTDSSMRQLVALTADNATQKPTLDTLDRELAMRFQLLGAAMNMRGENSPATPARRAVFADGRDHMDRIRVLLGEVKAEETRLLTERQAASTRRIRAVMLVLSLGGALAVFIGFAVNIYLAGLITEGEQMSRELTAQLDDLVTARRELAARQGQPETCV